MNAAIGRAARDAERTVAAGSEREREAARRQFRRRLARGNYGALFDEGVGRVLAEAAAERGLVRELGALRLAMARLLAEEEDAEKLALGIARLANAASRVARTQQAIGGDDGDRLQRLLGEVLAEMDAEAGGGPLPAAARRPSAEIGGGYGDRD